MSTKKSMWISLYIHPRDKKLTLEHGKINANEVVYRFDNKKKDFVEMGSPHLLEYIKLPKLMTREEAFEWVGTQEFIRLKLIKYHKQTFSKKM